MQAEGHQLRLLKAARGIAGGFLLLIAIAVVLPCSLSAASDDKAMQVAMAE